MTAKVVMDVEQYLHTGFKPDCEYLDGEIVERNRGEISHGDVQSTRGYRVADIAVWRDDNIGAGIPTIPPFLAVEILSPEDRMVRMAPKVQEYLSIGVPWVWVIDPEERAALVYSQAHPEGSTAAVLRTQNPDIEIPLESAFDLDA